MKTTHEAHLRGISLGDPTWHQSGVNLPAVQGRALPQIIPNPEQSPGVEPTPFITEWDYNGIVIKVSRLMGQPLQSLRVLEQCGRVYLTEFVPHVAVDPVLPVAMIGLGDEHDNAYRRLALQLISWSPGMSSQDSWFSRCKHYARPCMIAAFERLTEIEAEYYSRQMMLTMANPDRRNLNVPAPATLQPSRWHYAYER